MATPNPKTAAKSSPIAPASSNAGGPAGSTFTTQDTKLLSWIHTNRERIVASLLYSASRAIGGEMSDYQTLANQLSAMTGLGVGTGQTMAAGAGAGNR
jgi:hypothetical protein